MVEREELDCRMDCEGGDGVSVLFWSRDERGVEGLTYVIRRAARIPGNDLEEDVSWFTRRLAELEAMRVAGAHTHRG